MAVVVPTAPARPSVVGLVPGSFDPPTLAHEALADGLSGLGCDLVLYVWSVRTLPKEAAPGGDPAPPLLDEATRLDCLEALAAAGSRRGVALASHGLLAEQAEGARRAFPDARLVFGVGSDKVLQLLDPRWYDDRTTALDHLTGLATIAYAIRAGELEAVQRALADPRNAPWRRAFVALRLVPEIAGISSRSVRSRIRAGVDVKDCVPACVAPFLANAGPGRGT